MAKSATTITGLPAATAVGQVDQTLEKAKQYFNKGVSFGNGFRLVEIAELPTQERHKHVTDSFRDGVREIRAILRTPSLASVPAPILRVLVNA
jgi:hypothetical protein